MMYSTVHGNCPIAALVAATPRSSDYTNKKRYKRLLVQHIQEIEKK